MCGKHAGWDAHVFDGAGNVPVYLHRVISCNAFTNAGRKYGIGARKAGRELFWEKCCHLIKSHVSSRAWKTNEDEG